MAEGGFNKTYLRPVCSLGAVNDHGSPRWIGNKDREIIPGSRGPRVGVRIDRIHLTSECLSRVESC